MPDENNCCTYEKNASKYTKTTNNFSLGDGTVVEKRMNYGEVPLNIHDEE